MKLWSRALAILAVLAVPLALALAIQALAARPGPPPVPDSPVRVSGSQPAAEGRPAPAPAAEATPAPTAAPSAGPDGPRVITPVVPRAVAGDGEGPEEVDDADDMIESEDEPDDG